MGNSFSTIVIKCERESKETNLKKLVAILQENYTVEKSEISLKLAFEEVWRRDSERLLLLYSNNKAIKIEDLTESLEPNSLQKISAELSSEALRATNADTAGICQILLFQNGEHIREKTLGDEWESLEEFQKYFPDATEKDLEEIEVGIPTEYEINGSSAIAVIEEFEKGLIAHNEYSNFTASIYKYKNG